MKIKKLLIFIFLSMIILSGCSNDDAYNNAIQKGLDHIGSEEYQKAEGAFELALEEKEDDEKATNLLHQTVSYQEAEEAFKDADFELAEEKSEEVIKLEGYSSALVKKTENILESIKKLKSTLVDVESEYEDASKQYEEKNYEEASTITENILSKDLKHSFFNSVVKETEELQEDIKASQAEKKKADTENKEKKEKPSQANKKDNVQDEDDYINSVSPHNKDKEILTLRGYAIYIEDGMEYDAETDEAVLSNHPMYEKENIEDALSWIEGIYESGMSKEELKNIIYENSELTHEIISKAVDNYWSENF